MLKNELNRVISKRINIILFAVIIILAIAYSAFAIFSNTYVDNEGKTTNNLLSTRHLIESKKKFSGEMTTDKLEQVISQNQKVDLENTSNQDYATYIQPSTTLSEFINKIISSNDDYNPYAIYEFPPNQAKNLYKILQENRKKITKQIGDTNEKKQFIENQFNKSNLPINYHPIDSWESLITPVTTFSLILIIISSFMTASIFSEEFRLKTNQVFFSTCFGQTKAIRSKLLVGLFISSAIYLIGISIISFLSLFIMGVSGFNTPYLIELPNCLYSLSYGQLYLLIIICGYVANILATTIAMFLSATTKSATIATSISFLLFCVLPFVSRLFNFSTFFQLTPDNLVNIMNTIRKPYLYQIGGIVFRQIPFIIGFYLLLSLISLPLTYVSYKRNALKN